MELLGVACYRGGRTRESDRAGEKGREHQGVRCLIVGSQSGGRISSKGQTFTELVIVIVILGVISLVFASIFGQAADNYSDVDEMEGILQDCRMASERMVREIRSIKDQGSYKEATATSLYFRTIEDDSVKFSWDGTSGGDLLMQRNLVESVLASDIDSAGFSYFDSTGTGAGSTQDIWRIEFTLKLAEGDNAVQMRNNVYVRNH